MYYESFTSNNVIYYKFTSPIGDPYYCSKIINGQEIEISFKEFDTTRIFLHKQFLKFIIYKFFFDNKYIFSISITSNNINIISPTLTAEIKYFEIGNIEEKLIDFDKVKVERFINYLLKNNLDKLFITNCLSIFEFEFDGE